MSGTKIIGLALLIAGILALIYGGFTYTRATHSAKLGPLEVVVKDKETVNVPAWAGGLATLAGGALLLFGAKRT